MVLDSRKHGVDPGLLVRDLRPVYQRIKEDFLQKPTFAAAIFAISAFLPFYYPAFTHWIDLVFLFNILYFRWLIKGDHSVIFKLPMGTKHKDSNNDGPGRDGKAEGILYLGNLDKSNEEIWFTNSDTRTHILYLGTTGAGKTEGLKSMVTNALCWGSGFVYIDGKADTDLWSSLSSLTRRFGRDDDLLVLNYMTGNSDIKAPSNSMNPFATGSASYLTNMLVSLMPAAEGDNAMWKERAVSLVGSLMPALTWKRDNQDIPMSVTTIRKYLDLKNIIQISRDENIPPHITEGIQGYLNTLPGYMDEVFDDNGNVRSGPDAPMVDTTTVFQQHGYLSMQFTRSLQSLGDEYGYIFDTQAPDVEMVDVVLNRRIVVVLIPALEKSGDEIANLGKIVSATIKGMMGSTLGSSVEGDTATVIDNKATTSSTPFMTVFDEVGYYTAEGMAVMAAQARSLGFSLVFSGQDLPAMRKRVREEANSITANCNIKIFGKLEDPTETKEFFEKTVGEDFIMQTTGYSYHGSSLYDDQKAGVKSVPKADYGDLRGYTEGQAVITFANVVGDARIFYCNPGHAKAMRVTRFMSLPATDERVLKNIDATRTVRDRLVDKNWTAKTAIGKADTPAEIEAIAKSVNDTKDREDLNNVEKGIAAIPAVHLLTHSLDEIKEAPPEKPPVEEQAIPKETSIAPVPEINIDDAAKNILKTAGGDIRKALSNQDDPE